MIRVRSPLCVVQRAMPSVHVAPTPAAAGLDVERHGHVDESARARMHYPKLRGCLERGGHAALDRLGHVATELAGAQLPHQRHDHVQRNLCVIHLRCTAQ